MAWTKPESDSPWVHKAVAAVVELVDTLASGANLRKEVGVQISPATQF